MGIALSNVYYPPGSRTRGEMESRLVTSFSSSALGNSAARVLARYQSETGPVQASVRGKISSKAVDFIAAFSGFLISASLLWMAFLLFAALLFGGLAVSVFVSILCGQPPGDFCRARLRQDGGQPVISNVAPQVRHDGRNSVAVRNLRPRAGAAAPHSCLLLCRLLHRKNRLIAGRSTLRNQQLVISAGERLRDLKIDLVQPDECGCQPGEQRGDLCFF